MAVFGSLKAKVGVSSIVSLTSSDDPVTSGIATVSNPSGSGPCKIADTGSKQTVAVAGQRAHADEEWLWRWQGEV
jgi:hypothetical protein